MADGNRVYPVNRLVLHHSVGPEFRDADHHEIAQWYSSIGYGRAYENGAINPNHTYKGGTTYSQTQFAGHWHSGKYCIFPVMDDPWNNVAWHAGNWSANQQSVGIENCGNYLNQPFNDVQRRAVADFWRARDKQLAGKTYINGHKDFSSTACPAQIYNALPTIIKYINNPPVVTPPTPPTPPTPTDPCKDVKARLLNEKARTKALVAEVDILENSLEECATELDACQKELKDAQTELEYCKENSGGCEAVKTMSWVDIFMCKIKRSKE